MSKFVMNLVSVKFLLATTIMTVLSLNVYSREVIRIEWSNGTAGGDYASTGCETAQCAADHYCAQVIASVNANPDRRNPICPINLQESIDQVIDIPTAAGVEPNTEPYVIRKAEFSMSWERQFGGEWYLDEREYAVQGRPRLSCDCDENYISHTNFFGVFYCLDIQPLPEYFELDGAGYIYDYRDNNHEFAPRCPARRAPDKDLGCGTGTLTQNPCNVANGNKYRNEVDVSAGPLTFSRSYNSLTPHNYGLGAGWLSNHHKSFTKADNRLIFTDGTGRGETWFQVFNSNLLIGDPESNYSVTRTTDGYSKTSQSGVIELFNDEGLRLSKRYPNGETLSYSYTPTGLLSEVQNQYGYQLILSYDNGLLQSVTDSLGAELKYEYDQLANLVAVIYPDQTPEDFSDNPKKVYHYENLDFPHNLTGITDENGDRYATFSYDQDGRAISSELGSTSNSVGQEKVRLDYQD